MRWKQPEIDSKKGKTPQVRARRDLIVIVVLALIGCVIVLSDPDRAFEWLAGRKVVQFDEFLTAVTILGIAFAVFSWRRWTDLSRQVGEYKRLQDPSAADWRRFGRLPGFTNCKPKYRKEDGLFPFVRRN
jgi:hypothetical protein